ncbi:cytochrome P450 [Lactarius akahatsu]|uniref:Cytochrome P450 n=1 Tax=Lactarius akahatsu TaxID=416441 RepID=A0AAD4QA89_9AGAM|nr:cytochrome P450 [Lactarius akahatsu]
MFDLAQYDFALVVVVSFSGLALLVMRASKRRLPYPPGPKRLPVVGNLFSMPSREEWITYKNWSEESGSDIIHTDVMGSHIVILNSIKAANDLFEKRSSIYSDRPSLVALEKLFGMDYNIALSQYGPAWRHSRREFQAYLSPADLEAYQPLEQQAVHRLLRNLLSSPDNFEIVWRDKSSCQSPMGSMWSQRMTHTVADAENVLRAAAVATTKEALLLDLIPWLAVIKMPSWFPGARYKRYARDWRPIVVGAVKTTYNKVKSEFVAGTATPSVAAKLISKLDEDSTEEDLWVARAIPVKHPSTSPHELTEAFRRPSPALQTFILAMTLYPDVQRKAQTEIDQVIGNSRLPDFSDQDALPYVQAVLKEVLRWHPVTPLGVPHKVRVSDIYEGYYIPAGSIIIPNVWGMMRDPAVFTEPDRFYPERWLSADAPTFPNQAFGFGARRCPGRFLARASIWSNIAGILATFHISPTEDGPPEEAYSSGTISCVASALIPLNKEKLMWSIL